MKSKRRHELETNVLADQLGYWFEYIRPYVTTIVFVVVAIVAVVGAWYYWNSKEKALVSEAWRTYMFAASDPQGNMVETLSTVSDNFSDTKAGLWAALTEADIQANRGVRMLFEDKATAETSIDEAIKTYQQLLDRDLIKQSPMVERRAHFGMAQALEATGQLDKAIEHYQKVVGAVPESALAKAAERRVEDLSRNKTKAWYEWLAAQEPPAKKPKAPVGAPGGGLKPSPGGLGSLSEGVPPGFKESFNKEAAEPKAPSEGDAEKKTSGGGKTTPLQRLELDDVPSESKKKASKTGNASDVDMELPTENPAETESE